MHFTSNSSTKNPLLQGEVAACKADGGVSAIPVGALLVGRVLV